MLWGEGALLALLHVEWTVSSKFKVQIQGSKLMLSKKLKEGIELLKISKCTTQFVKGPSEHDQCSHSILYLDLLLYFANNFIQ